MSDGMWYASMAFPISQVRFRMNSSIIIVGITIQR
jgi:hypothetical protein